MVGKNNHGGLTDEKSGISSKESFELLTMDTHFNAGIHDRPILIFLTSATLDVAGSIMKCNTWESRKVSAILSVYGKTI